MKTTHICFALLLSLAPTSVLVAEPAVEMESPAKEKKPLKIGKITFEGGDGSSIEQAVVIKGAKGEMEGVEAESKWVKKMHQDWTKGGQALMSKDGKSYDKIEYTTAKGETKTLYFDITDFFGK